MTISVFMLYRFETSRFSAIRSLCAHLDHWDFLAHATCGDKGVLGGSPGGLGESPHNPGSSPALADCRGHRGLPCAAPASPGGGGSLKGSSDPPVLHQSPLVSLAAQVALGPVLHLAHKPLQPSILGQGLTDQAQFPLPIINLSSTLFIPLNFYFLTALTKKITQITSAFPLAQGY